MNPIQLRVTITDEIRDQLQKRAEEYGLTMSVYVKSLIIQDLKQPSQQNQKTISLPEENMKAQRRRYFLRKLQDLK